MTTGWDVAAETSDRVGEGPVWIAGEPALHRVDILGPGLRRLSLSDGMLLPGRAFDALS